MASKPGKLDKGDWKKIAIGFAIALAGAAVAYAADVVIPAMEGSDEKMLVLLAAVAAGAINVIRKWLSDTTR